MTCPSSPCDQDGCKFFCDKSKGKLVVGTADLL